MKVCDNCNAMNPPAARFCMRCGQRLADEPAGRDASDADKNGFRLAGMSLFTLSILGSLLLSLILMTVFGLPVFIMAAFLPLLWFGRKK